MVVWLTQARRLAAGRVGLLWSRTEAGAGPQKGALSSCKKACNGASAGLKDVALSETTVTKIYLLTHVVPQELWGTNWCWLDFIVQKASGSVAFGS